MSARQNKRAVPAPKPVAGAVAERPVAPAIPSVAEAAPVPLAEQPETVIAASQETIEAALDIVIASPPVVDPDDATLNSIFQDHRAVRVTAKQAERRRAGFKFTPEPVLLAPEMVDGEKLLVLASDPFLVVEITDDGENFTVVSADIAAAFV